MTTQAGELVDNPFYVPDEYEVFLKSILQTCQIFKLKEKEKDLKRMERQKNQNLKIWEKGIKPKGLYTVGKLKEMCKIDDERDEETMAKLNIVEAADSAVKNRVRQKEPMHQFVDKKREMLLFQMLIDHKREMINQFEELTRLHRKGLEKSEQLLEEDLELFNKFLEENKNNSRDAVKAADKEAKLKQEKVNEIKTQIEHKADLITKNAQKIDNLEDLWKYKKFLDKINPKEFQDIVDKKKNERQQRAKRSAAGKERQKARPLADYYNQTITPEIAELLEDSDEEFEMYFQSPNQLEEIFQGLEERNLFLIAHTKEREQNVEELRQKFESKKKQLEEKYRNSIQQKNDLIKNIEQVSEQIKLLKQIRNDNEVQEQLKLLEQQIQRIYKNINPEKTDVRKDLSGIEMLKEMEKKLELFIREIKQYNSQAPDLVKTKEQDCIKEKKEQMKISKQEADSLEQLRKQKEQQKEMVVQKRTGRPVMVRSWPPQKQQEEKIVDEIPEEEIERLKYFT